MNTTTIISRETIERYICSSGQEKLQKKLVLAYEVDNLCRNIISVKWEHMTVDQLVVG